MKKLLLTVSIFALIFAVYGNSYSQNTRILAQAQKLTGDKFTYTTRTLKGANVYAVSRPTAAVLRSIDDGLSALFAAAKSNNYRNKLSYSDYSIYIARADRTKDSSGQYSPDFAVGAAQYAGSEYDQGGFIYAAGMVIANDPCSFVIAEHTKNFQRISDVVRYEGEHLVLYHNDRRRYTATADHSRGGAHPIL